LAVVIIGGYSYVKGINNNVGYEQGINEAWGNVQTSTKEEMT
jgi:LemA protein